MNTRPLLAYKNDEFLDKPEARSVRLLSEYLEPLSHFRREKVSDTIVFFGSARIREDGPMARYYADARELAKQISQWTNSFTCSNRRYVICSGGGPGIMEAANRGAADAGAKNIGLNIGLPFEQFPNPYITPELSFEFHYFFMRKFWFAYMAKALVVFPGGFGTLDEMFEILTLAQTHKMVNQLTVIVYGSSYWKSVLNFELLAAKGAIAQKDLSLIQFADTPEEAFALLQAGLHVHIHTPTAPFPERRSGEIPEEPLPTAQEILGPDFNKSRA